MGTMRKSYLWRQFHLYVRLSFIKPTEVEELPDHTVTELPITRNVQGESGRLPYQGCQKWAKKIDDKTCKIPPNA